MFSDAKLLWRSGRGSTNLPHDIMWTLRQAGCPDLGELYRPPCSTGHEQHQERTPAEKTPRASSLHLKGAGTLHRISETSQEGLPPPTSRCYARTSKCMRMAGCRRRTTKTSPKTVWWADWTVPVGLERTSSVRTIDRRILINPHLSPNRTKAGLAFRSQFSVQLDRSASGPVEEWK